MNGKMTEQSFGQLVDAANSNDGFAMTILGVILINNQHDVEAGIKQILFAADRKNVFWAKNLQLYMRGHKEWELPIHHHALVDSDAIEQLRLYSSNNIWAMTILGNLYYCGLVTPRYTSLATKLLRKASDSGCLLAQELIRNYCIPNRTDVDNLLENIEDRDNSKYWIK